jgi:predicted ArsR family transcriptional regulator
MNQKKSTDERILDYLKKKGTATVDEIAAALAVGRTSVRKYLAGLRVDKKVERNPGGREGRRKLPDVFSLSGGSSNPKSGGSKNRRLAPGDLDELVLGYMRRHKDEAPHTASAIAKGIERSSGAVANCLGRQEKQKKVRLVKPKPREYALVETRK